MEDYFTAILTSQEVASVGNGASTTGQKGDNVSKDLFACVYLGEREPVHVFIWEDVEVLVHWTVSGAQYLSGLAFFVQMNFTFG